MANIKSATKRIDIAKRNELKNKRYESWVKKFIKKYLHSLELYKKTPTEINFQIVIENLNSAYSKLDKAKKTKVLHRNTVARKKSALKIALNSSKSH